MSSEESSTERMKATSRARHEKKARKYNFLSSLGTLSKGNHKHSVNAITYMGAANELTYQSSQWPDFLYYNLYGRCTYSDFAMRVEPTIHAHIPRCCAHSQ